MDRTLLSRAVELISEQRKKRRWAKVFSSMAAVVVFCTTYALILPAITLEADPVCGMEAHTHGAECYETQTIEAEPVMQCASEGMEPHTHGVECYLDEEMTELVCPLEENAPHVCGEMCTAAEGDSYQKEVLICVLPEHTHDTTCYPEVPEEALDSSEPEEPLLPADPVADLETAEDWEETFAHVTLSGTYGQDVLAIADTQVGYRESKQNYILDEDGTVRGYTRYGQWRDAPYGNWNIAFAAFCLTYAQVPEEVFPQAEDGREWIAVLQQRGIYRTPDSYTPRPGDLVFFEQEDLDDVVRTALVRTQNLDGSITIIEGDSQENDVCLNELVLTNSRILGYGLLAGEDGSSGGLPETEISGEAAVEEAPLTPSLSEEVEEVIAMIDLLPDSASVEETLISCEEAEDWDGYEAVFYEVAIAGRGAYEAYASLTEEEQALVTNFEKLQELEWIWSMATFADTQTAIRPGTYGNYHFSFNEGKDTFIRDPAYEDYYNENSPLGTAGSFHLVAFGTANLGTHTNGNVLAHTLEAGSNFGTNNYEKELTYALYYERINAGSASGTADHILVVGSENMVTLGGNGDHILVNDSKIDKPYNIIQDMDSDVGPFVDLDRVEREITGLSARLAVFDTANVNYSFSDQNRRYIELTDPDAVGVLNIAASELNNYQNNPLKIRGFYSGHSGSIVINVDCTGVDHVYLPNEAKVTVDGKEQSTNEVTEFSAGKVVWNFLNAEGCTI